MFRDVVKVIRSQAKGDRNLQYVENGVGITSLLNCPLKHELRKQYPDIIAESTDIDDGFNWEHQVKNALSEIYKDAFQEEKDLIYEVDGLIVHGHLDCFVELPDKVIGIELKAPKLVVLKEPLSDTDIEAGYYEDVKKLIVHNNTYWTQAKIQKYILQKLYPNKQVEQYLFYKSVFKHKNYLYKLYSSSLVDEDLTDEEILNIVNDFRNNKTPRYKNECEYYCNYKKLGLCNGIQMEIKEQTATEKIKDLIKLYKSTEEDLKLIEKELKKLVKGTIILNGKECGWVKKETKQLNVEKILEKIDKKDASKYLMVKWQTKSELLLRFRDEIVDKIEETIEWKL